MKYCRPMFAPRHDKQCVGHLDESGIHRLPMAPGLRLDQFEE